MGFLDNENKLKNQKNLLENKNTLEQNEENLKDNCNEENNLNNNNSIKPRANLLPKLTLNSEPPYLPSKSLLRNPRNYTLVLDLDETLVHYVEDNDSAFIQIRPGAELFLEEMYKYYEIVIFTAAMQDVKK
jgi:TFIIF-interacting CTD phosphatase-like protein